MLYPLTFHPIFKERIWGGRNLERLYQKPLPPGVPIGESWEISDRPGDVSVIANGPLAGKDLRWLMENRAAELLGGAKPATADVFRCYQNSRCPGKALPAGSSASRHKPPNSAANPKPRCGTSPKPRPARNCTSA